MAVATIFSDMWSATGFKNPELARYAERQILADTRRGLQIVAALAIIAQIAVGVLVLLSGSSMQVLSTNLIVGLLSVHVLVSANFVHDLRALHLLGVAFLILSAVAITFLAHRTGDLSIDMMSAVVMLLVVVPLIPWAMREAVVVVILTYFLLTLSFLSVPGRFDAHSLTVLQMLVLGSALVVVVVTARNARVRKHDIRARFELERAQERLELLSKKDHLTDAWNRRHLEDYFPQMRLISRERSIPLHVIVLDIDDFKGINDRFGHHTGDEILITLARVFMEQLGEAGCLIRLGGDEFQILYCGGNPEQLIQDAIAEIQKSEVVAGLAGRRNVTLSAGIVTIQPDRAAELNDLYKTADRALYAGKTAGRAVTLGSHQSDSLARTGTWQL